MSDVQNLLHNDAANASDYDPVLVCFQDKGITALFAELLTCRGVAVEIVSDTAGIPADARIVTEPHYFARLNPGSSERCLVVGDRCALTNCRAIHLSRPLTEEKIEAALEKLLGTK